MKKITFLWLMLLFASFSNAQINSYVFAQSSTTYTEISGGTPLGTTSSDDQVFLDPTLPAGDTVKTGVGFAIGFDYVFNGYTYNRFAVNNNGWISLGSSLLTPAVNINSTSSYIPLASVSSDATADLVARIVALGKDLQAQTTSSLRFETIGAAPNRILVVQWKNYKKFGSGGTGDSFNFQIRLHETTNVVEIVYGNFISNTTANATFQSGLRAGPATVAQNFINRTSATSWENTTQGVAPENAILMNDVIKPTNGLTFSWAPALCNGPIGFTTTNATTNAANISWNSAASAANGYEYVVGTTNTFPASSGTATTATTASITGLTADTIYYVFLRSNCTNGFSNWIPAGSFRTLCNAQVAFTENFDSYTTDSILPNCWSRTGSTGSVNMTTGGVTPGSAPNRLYMFANGSTPTVAYAILPRVSNLQAGTHRIVFRAYATATNRTLDVGYFSVADPTTFVLLEAVNLPSTTPATAIKFKIAPGALPAGVENIVFRNAGIPTGSTTLYIDDVSWEPLPSCPDASALVFDTVTNSSANISWTPGASETSWQYVYGLATVTDPSTLVPTDVTNNPTASLTGLTGFTTYKFWVRSNCGAGNFGIWSDPVSFTTLCNPVTDFTENFDSYTTGTTVLPTCWTKKGTSDLVYVTTGGVAPGTPPNRLYMSATATGSTTAYAVLRPVSNLSASTHRLSFKAYSTTANRVLQVGYFADPADLQSFVAFETFGLPSTAATTAQEFITAPVDVPAGVTNIVFRNGNVTTGTAVIYIDDLVWEPIPSCPDISVLTANSITNNSANITWNTGGSETSWQYVYGLATVTDPSTLTPIDVNNNPEATLSGLTGATNYKFWVRSKCAATVFGSWSDPYAFTTKCDPVTTFTENFDSYTTGVNSLPSCWSRTGNSTAAYVTTGSVTPASAPNRFYMNASGSASTPTVAYAILRPVSNLQAATHRLRFKAYASVADRFLEVGYFTDASDTSTFVLLETLSLPSSAAAAQEFNVVPAGIPAGITSLVFRNAGITTGATTLYIDDLFWEPVPPCPDVSGLNTTAVTDTTANIVWNPGGSETAWEYVYGLSSVTDPATLTPTLVQNNPNATLINLASNTSYKFWVRSSCGSAGLGYWVGPFTFKTTCTPLATLPWDENFDALTPGTNVFPSCWAYTNTSSTWSISTSPVAYSGANSLRRTWSTDGWAFTPTVMLTQGVSYTFSYYLRTNDNVIGYNISVGVGQGQSATAMTQSLYDITGYQGPAWNKFSFEFTPTTTAAYSFGVHIVAPTTAPNGINMDNFHVGLTPSCVEPTALTAATIETTTATVAWNAPSTTPANGYEYYYSTTNTTPTAQAVASGTTAAASLQLTGLTPATNYYVWIRSVCSTTDKSEWSNMLSFVTLCAVVTPAYTQDFAVFPPNCWNRAAAGTVATGPTDTANGIWFQDGFLNSSTTGAIKVNLFGTNRIGWIISPSFDLSSGTNTLSFNYAVTDWGNTDSSAMGSDDSVKVAMSVDGGTTWTELMSFTAANNIPNTSQTFTAALTTVSPNVKFAFIATDGTVEDTVDYDFFIDNFSVQPNLSVGDSTIQDFRFSPNPVTSILNLAAHDSISDVSVLNVLGQQLMTKAINAKEGQIDMSTLPAGTYIIIVHAGENSKTIKVLKN